VSLRSLYIVHSQIENIVFSIKRVDLSG
jgi:hypothetical protein